MSIPLRRDAAAPRPRIVAAALVLLALLATSVPALGARPAPAAAAAANASWAGRTVAATIQGAAPVAVSAADQARLRAVPASATVAFHPATGKVRLLAGSRRTPLASDIDLRAAARRLGLLTAADRALAANAGPTEAAAAGQGSTARGTGRRATLTPDTAARAYLSSVAPLFGVERLADLATDRVSALSDGRAVVRYQQRRAGAPVIGGEFIVQVGARGQVVSVSGEALPAGDRVAQRPTIGVQQARRIAAAWVAREVDGDASAAVTRSEGLAVLDPRILGSGGPPIPRLVWRIDARIDPPASGSPRSDTGTRTAADHDHAGGPVHALILVDALDGAVLDSLTRIAAGLDRRICDYRNVRSKEFRCRPGRITRDEGDSPVGLRQVDAMYQLMARLHGFYRSRFGHDGVDGEGSRFTATVRYCLPTWCPMHNAFWEWGPQQATFGDGWADVDDFVGHEFTHGVLDSHARLFYEYQSGAMNESFADIFGEGFDLLNDWGNDSAGVRWLLGEDLRGGAVRDMEEPGRFGDPDRMRSSRWYTGTGDFGGVHHNSGVGNRTAALIADGGRFNGRTIKGIGLARMLRVQYEAMSNRLTSASDYLDLHDALRFGCLDLVGKGGITLAHCASVEDAVTATELDRLPVTSAPRQAPTCRDGRYPVTAFEDDLERPGEDRWRSVVLAGDRNPWHYPPNPNGIPLWDGTWASSGRYNFFGDDLGRVTSSAMTLTQPVRVPNGGFLRFEHGYRFDYGSRYYDGGVVEVSVEGGPWIDLGSRFTHSGYTGTLATGRGNPLGGRRAFVAVSRGWGAARADLSDWAGKDVRLRFRMGTDSSGGGMGWYIDDIRIYRCVRDDVAPTGSVTIGTGDPATRDRAQTLSISAEDAASGVVRMRVSNRGTLRDGVLRDGIESPFRGSLDWNLTTAALGGTAGDGTKRVFLQLRDRAGNWSAPVSDSVILDTRPPTVGAPTMRFPEGTTVSQEAPRIPVRLAFSATDATSGVARTELERRRGDGAWQTVDLGAPDATTVVLRFPDGAGIDWRLRARARDEAGSWSDLRASGPWRIGVTQDGSQAWTYTGDWTSRTPGDAYGSTMRTADDADARASIPVTAAAVALVAERGPSMGIARIRIDNETVATVDLYAAEPAPRSIVWASTLASGAHTVAVIVTGDRNEASGGTRVAVDALLTIR